jgi:2'-5' RNA ligase
MSTAGEPATLRLFVACELPRDARQQIADWQQRSLAGNKDVRLNHALHVTLAFLGNTPAESVAQITDALAGLDFHAVPVEVGEPVFLPLHGAKRVVALPLRETGDTLSVLQAKVSEALAARGLYRPQRHPWLPHVTVARFRRPGHPFPLQNVNIGGFGVVRMVLYSSLLERAGAVHTPLKVFPAS